MVIAEVRCRRLRTGGEEMKTLSVDWSFPKLVKEREEEEDGRTKEGEMKIFLMASI